MERAVIHAVVNLNRAIRLLYRLAWKDDIVHHPVISSPLLGDNAGRESSQKPYLVPSNPARTRNHSIRIHIFNITKLPFPLAQGQSCAVRSPRFVRGHQATDSYEDKRAIGGSTLPLGYAIADLATTIPVTTSLGPVHHTMRRHRKHVNIQSARNSKISAYEYHTVNLRLCQRRVFQTESTTMCCKT